MTPEVQASLEAALGSRVQSHAALSGGDINEAHRVSLTDGRVVFVKTNPGLSPAAFHAEARGLDWLREAGTLRLPEVLAVSHEGDPAAFLVLEMLEPARRAEGFDETLGRGLAALHRHAPAGFGLDHDNLIGSLPQDNTPAATW